METRRVVFDALEGARQWEYSPKRRQELSEKARRLIPDGPATWDEWQKRLPALRAELRKDAEELLASPRLSEREHAARWIWEIAGEEDDALILRILDDPEPRVSQWTATHARHSIPLSDEALDRVKRELVEAAADEVEDGYGLSHLLWMTTNPRATPLIIELLGRADIARVHHHLLDALIYRTDPAAAPYFTSVLRDPESKSRVDAARGLCGIDDPSLAPAVLALLKDENLQVVRAVLWYAPWREIPGLAAQVRPLLQHPDGETRKCAAEALVRLRQPDGVEWFVRVNPEDRPGKPDLPSDLVDHVGWPFPDTYPEEALNAEWERFRKWWSEQPHETWEGVERAAFDETVRRFREAQSRAAGDGPPITRTEYFWILHGLESEDAKTRTRSIDLLTPMNAGDALGFDVTDDEKSRRHAVERWKIWIVEQNQKRKDGHEDPRGGRPGR